LIENLRAFGFSINNQKSTMLLATGYCF